MKIAFHYKWRILAATLAAGVFCSAPLFAQTNSEATNALLKLAPPYGELPPTFWEQNTTSILLAGIGLAAFIATGFWFFLRPKQKKIVPPEVQAREALQKLSAQPEDGAVLSRVSQITRHYFIAAFHLAAGELTTAEFNHELERSGKTSPELSAATIDFLRECDARKFSTATSSETLDAASRALKLIEQAEQSRAQLRQPAEMQTQGRRA